MKTSSMELFWTVMDIAQFMFSLVLLLLLYSILNHNHDLELIKALGTVAVPQIISNLPYHFLGIIFQMSIIMYTQYT